MNNDLIRLEQAQEQDIAASLEWWRTASAENKFKVWDEIQRTHNNKVREIASRFAQVGYTHIAILAEQAKAEGGAA